MVFMHVRALKGFSLVANSRLKGSVPGRYAGHLVRGLGIRPRPGCSLLKSSRGFGGAEPPDLRTPHQRDLGVAHSPCVYQEISAVNAQSTITIVRIAPNTRRQSPHAIGSAFTFRLATSDP